MDLLKLIALDGDDVGVFSAHLQDAVVDIVDVHWRPAEHRLVIGLNRFDWEAASSSSPQFRRRRAALRFERVLSCQCRNVEPADREQVLNLLALSFDESDSPGGVVTLMFSGGKALRLQVECLEAELADLGPSWVTDHCPAHAVDNAVDNAAEDFRADTMTAPPRG